MNTYIDEYNKWNYYKNQIRNNKKYLIFNGKKNLLMNYIKNKQTKK